MIKIEHYYTLNSYFKNKYGEKVGKLSLDGNFTCPNRDGKISELGCIFCSEKGSGDFTSGNLNIQKQIIKEKEMVRNKWNNNRFIAYFQNFTNTYADVNFLRNLYEEVLKDEEIIGIAIATRADCLNKDILDLLEEFSKRCELWLEIGMQSAKESTIEYIDRGYSHKYLDNKLKELKSRNIKFVLHVIFGLPGETKSDMLDSIKYINEVKPFGIKIHSLYIQNDSRIYEDFINKKFELLTKEEYTDLVAESLSILDKNIVVHRITGDGDKNKLIAPLWAADKLGVISEIQRKIKSRKVWSF